VQRITDQHGDRFAVDDMARGPAPPGRRVVHGGKIIMDEGVGVNQLHRAGSGQDRLDRHPRHLRAGEHEDGPQPLAAGKHAVAHRLQHQRRGLPVRGDKLVEGMLDRFPLLGEAHGHDVRGLIGEGQGWGVFPLAHRSIIPWCASARQLRPLTRGDRTRIATVRQGATRAEDKRA